MSLPPVQALRDADVARLVERSRAFPAEVVERSRAIVERIRTEGDAALRNLTRELDGCDLADPFVPDAAWLSALAQVPRELQEAVDGSLRRIRAFHERQRRGADRLETAPGVLLGRRPVPFRSVGCYVPGGRASYPSTVLMTVIPAALAGVERIVVATPPRPDGSVDPLVLYAAKAAGATHVLRAGGTQAIAALAYGTARVPAVECIVGPGNAYVTAAKSLVADRVRTDGPAGPSEILIVADASADPVLAALEMLAQAEHDPDAQCLLVTDRREVAEAVRSEVERRLPSAARREVVEASLERHAAFLVAPSLDAALAFSDLYAPEHLTLLVLDPEAALARIRNAGSVFLGPHAAVALGDYGSGTNHVLPTMGNARFRGGLSVDDFVKWVTWQKATPAGLKRIGPDVARLARAEGLVAHAESVEERLRRIKA